MRSNCFWKAVLAVSLVAIAAAFVVGQPYALLDFETFRRQITEQSNMVRHAGLLPYTNQYTGVPKYLYEVQEIVLWCMGPALGLVALWASATRTITAARWRSTPISTCRRRRGRRRPAATTSPGSRTCADRSAYPADPIFNAMPSTSGMPSSV